MHIGDNFKSDYEEALKAGLLAFWAPSIYEELFRDTRFNQVAISKLDKKIDIANDNLFASFLLSHIARQRAEAKYETAFSIFGFMYGGALVFSYSKWLLTSMQLRGIDSLKLMARDGYIIEKILAILSPSVKCNTIYVNRKLQTKLLLKIDFDSGIDLVVTYYPNYSAQKILEMLFGDDSRILIEFIKRNISNSNSKNLTKKILKMCECEIQKLLSFTMNDYHEYLHAELNTDESIALVDCGWALCPPTVIT